MHVDIIEESIHAAADLAGQLRHRARIDIEGCEFLDISASFAMDAIKHTTALPLDHLFVPRS